MLQIVLNLLTGMFIDYILIGITFSICLALLCRTVGTTPFKLLEFLFAAILWPFIITKMIMLSRGEEIEE